MWILLIICTTMVFFEFILFRVWQISWICKFASLHLPNLGGFQHHFLKIFFWPKLFVISAKPASIMGVNMTNIHKVASDSFMGPWSVQLHKVQYSEGFMLDFMLCCLEIFNNFLYKESGSFILLGVYKLHRWLVDSTVLWHTGQVRGIYC